LENKIRRAFALIAWALCREKVNNVIPFVSLVGYSSSGKTKVMAELIRIFKSRGCRVAALKHAAHGYTMDPPGSDSWQYAQAGADQVIVVGPESFTIHEFYKEDVPLREILDRIDNVDIILIEGFKTQSGPKIEIYRQDYSPDRIPTGGQLLAIVSDVPLADEVPRFSFDELEGLADFIIQTVK
jgi:molybdopterin-guanine dinucleotide biosynthesis protein MobB